MLAISLEELVRESAQIWVGLPIEKHSRWETSRSARQIVTYTRLRRQLLVARSEADAGELWVRTRGGTVGEIGEIVHGEAQFSRTQPSLVFLGHGPVAYRVIGMAQGQFPVQRDVRGVQRLLAHPNLADLVHGERAAARELVGLALESAVSKVRLVQR
jgi:hypothetical protein